MELISLQPFWWLLTCVALLLGWRYSLVDAPLAKRMASFGFRVLSIVFLVLALCRPFAAMETTQLHVVFLVDVSQSVDLNSAIEATDEIQKSIDALETDDSFSLFAFGTDMRDFDSPEELKKTIQSWQEEGADDSFRSQTRLSTASLKSRLAFPGGKVKRMVVFSDGMDTGDQIAATLKQLSEEEIDVRLKRIDPLQFPEAAVVSVDPSTSLAFVGEVVRLSTKVTANQKISGKLRVIHRGVEVQTRDIKIEPGKPQLCFFDVDMVTPGNSRWTIELVPEEDHFPINNQRTCTVTVRGNPRILVLHEKEREMRAFERAMAEQDFSVDIRGKFGLPETMQDLMAFDAVVLADFPATLMTPRQMNLLKQYVQDFGGGLAMLGSENSFGLGGYHKTPVEDVLPLVSRFEKEKEKPSLSMVLVIDKSGSMSGVPMALARQAAKAAVELLGARDEVGVVGFDGSPVVISELTSAMGKDAIFANIDSLSAGGGTNMFPGMSVGRDMLEEANSKIKHMICLSDGHTQQADFESLVQAMTDSGITVSTVALGDADRNLLSTIAEMGRGRYYETRDPQSVPQIFTKETMQASKSAIKEDLFASVQTDDHPALAGFQKADLPFSLGYVMTQQKPTAQTLLVSENGDPLLAISRFGLGTGLAYTSDLTERWGGEWLAWPDCGKFWAQVLRSMIRRNNSEGITVQGQTVDDRWVLDIHSRDTNGSPQSLIDWELTLMDELGKPESVSVSEVGLGKYSAVVPLSDRGDFALQLRDPASDRTRSLHFNQPYPKEYSLSSQLVPAVAELASMESQDVRDDLVPHHNRRSVAHWFYFAALASLLVGNLIRRI